MKDKVSEVDQEQEKEEEEKQPAEAMKGDKQVEEKGKCARAPRQPKSLQIRVTLLDNSVYECELDVRTHTCTHTFLTPGTPGHWS